MLCVARKKHGGSVDTRVQRHLETWPVASERRPAAEYMPGLVGRQRCESSLEVPQAQRAAWQEDGGVN